MLMTTAPIGLSLKNIVAAIDFSPASKAALAYVVPIAREFGSTIHLLHVINPTPLMITTPAFDVGILPQIRDSAQADLRVIAANIHDVPCQVCVREGQVWEEVENLTRQTQVDLIVAGTSGKSRLGKLLMGSVAEEIFRKSTCPVLTVGPRVEASETSPTFKQILYLTNLKEESHLALQYALEIAARNKAQLMLLHVVEQNEPRAEDHDWLKDYRRMLGDLLPENTDLPIEPVLRIEAAKNVCARILWVAEEIKSDLIVMDVTAEEAWATHLQDRAYEIVSFANCPVLTVRARHTWQRSAGTKLRRNRDS